MTAAPAEGNPVVAGAVPTGGAGSTGPSPSDGAGVLLPAGVGERVRAAVAASIAPATRAAYRSDWDRFTTWAAASGHAPLPADPVTVASYLADAAALSRGLGGAERPAYAAATLARWVASINAVHAAAGHEPPGHAEVVRRTLAGIRRTRRRPPARRDPLLLTDIRTLLDTIAEQYGTWPAAVGARRDAALLLMGFAGAHRRSELTALTLADVTLHTEDGLHVHLTRSKTDQESVGTVRAIPRGRHPGTCPVCALIRWRALLDAHGAGGRPAAIGVMRSVAAGEGLHVCGIPTLPDPPNSDQPLFPTVHKTGRPGPGAMSGDALAAMIRRRAQAAGWPAHKVARLGGHSLRAGFVTEAFRAGAAPHEIMPQTGHRDLRTLLIYRRDHAPLTANAVTRLDL